MRCLCVGQVAGSLEHRIDVVRVLGPVGQTPTTVGLINSLAIIWPLRPSPTCGQAESTCTPMSDNAVLLAADPVVVRMVGC